MNRERICIDKLIEQDVVCGNPQISWRTDSSCLSIVCKEEKCIEVEIPDNCTDTCFTIDIQCEDPCFGTKTYSHEICLCNLSSECDDCSICVGGQCESYCAEGKKCLNGDCVDAVDDSDCPCNQMAVNGNCICPAGKFVNSSDCCVNCIENSDCDPCQVCVGGNCIPKICTGGVCNPSTGNCVECNESGDCPENECCYGGSCGCCAGYKYNPATGKCDEDVCTCTYDTDCPACYICSECECIPKPCPEGKICINDECIDECSDSSSDCPGRGKCLPYGDTSICVDCRGECDNNSTCNEGCTCINGECRPNDCYSLCSNAGDCGEGCGCFDGICYPCDSVACEDCYTGSGCECIHNICGATECIGDCADYSDCGDICGCYQTECIDCRLLNCEECAEASGCNCINNECSSSSKCKFNSNKLKWVKRVHDPGKLLEPAIPPLEGYSNVNATQLVSSATVNSVDVGFLHLHSFQAHITNYTGTGQWYYSSDINNKIPIPGGIYPDISLGQEHSPINYNVLGFYLIFEDDIGREIKFQYNRKPNTTLQDANSWETEKTSSTGIPAVYENSENSAWYLVLTDSNFEFVSPFPFNVLKKGPSGRIIDIIFTKETPRDLKAEITGCGSWQGDITVKCGEHTYNVAIPSFEVDTSTCCDPTDVNCVPISCTQDINLNVDLLFLPYFDTNGGGAVIPDLSVLTFAQVHRLGNICFSKEECEGNNDVQFNSGSFGPQAANTYQNITFVNGGKINIGEDCDLYIGDCTYLTGSVCVNGCDVLDILLLPYEDTLNKFIAIPSIVYSDLVYNWNTNIGNGPILNITTSVNNEYSIIEVDNNTDGLDKVTIQVIRQSAFGCNADAEDPVNPDPIEGCTNPGACNYNSDATKDNGTCIMPGCTDINPDLGGCKDHNGVCQPSLKDCCPSDPPPICNWEDINIQYVCSSGEYLKLVNPAYEYRINGVNVTNGYVLEPGPVVITIIDPDSTCRMDYTLIVPQCYVCSQDDCVPVQPNAGLSYITCQQTCGDIAGCTDPAACNYNPDSVLDNGTCFYIGCNDPDATNYDPNADGCICGDVSARGCCQYPGTITCANDPINFINFNVFYDCIHGLQIDNATGYSFFIAATSVSIGSSLPPGTHTLRIVNNSTGCERFIGLCVEQCYECVNDDCIPPANNLGQTMADCLGTCNPPDPEEPCSNITCVGGPNSPCDIRPDCQCINDLCEDVDPPVDCSSITCVGDTGNSPCDIHPECTCINGLCEDLDPPEGCTEPAACNYDADAQVDDGSCLFIGCTNPAATNYNPNATGCNCITEDTDDSCCIYPPGQCQYLTCDVGEIQSECDLQPGCQCSGNVCIPSPPPPSGCIPDNINFSWEYVPGTNGINLGDGLDPLTPQSSIAPIGMDGLPSQSGQLAEYFAHTFSFGTAENVMGDWSYSPNVGNYIPISTGNSLDIDQNDVIINHNLFGFRIIFQSNDGRTIGWNVLRTPSHPINQEGGWNIEIAFNKGTSDTIQGGTPSTWKLCHDNPDYSWDDMEIINESITDGIEPLSITFTPDTDLCLNIDTDGCGTYNAEVKMPCTGFSSKKDLMYVIDKSGSINTTEMEQFKSFFSALTETYESAVQSGNYRIGIVMFGEEGELLLPLTDDYALIMSTINSITRSNQVTNIIGGICEARQEFSSNGRNDADYQMIVASDGEHNRSTSTCYGSISTDRDTQHEILRQYATTIKNEGTKLTIVSAGSDSVLLNIYNKYINPNVNPLNPISSPGNATVDPTYPGIEGTSTYFVPFNDLSGIVDAVSSEVVEYTTVALPSFNIDSDSCCDDPDCITNPDICTNYSLVDIPLVVYPLNDGNQTYVAFPDITVQDFGDLYIQPDLCWSTFLNNGINDITIIPANSTELYTLFTMENQGCLRFGDVCENATELGEPTGDMPGVYIKEIYTSCHIVEVKVYPYLLSDTNGGTNVKEVSYTLTFNPGRLQYISNTPNWPTGNSFSNFGNLNNGAIYTEWSAANEHSLENHVHTYKFAIKGSPQFPVGVNFADNDYPTFTPTTIINDSGIIGEVISEGNTITYTPGCALETSECELLLGEFCLNNCDAFGVTIYRNGSMFVAIPSTLNANANFVWDTNLGQTPITDIQMNTPNTGESTATVNTGHAGLTEVTVTVNIPGEPDCIATYVYDITTDECHIVINQSTACS